MSKVDELQDKLTECEQVGSKALQQKVFAAKTNLSTLCAPFVCIFFLAINETEFLILVL